MHKTAAHAAPSAQPRLQSTSLSALAAAAHAAPEHESGRQCTSRVASAAAAGAVGRPQPGPLIEY